MPSIPGILSLCLLLFSPRVELRTNNDVTEYTGALYGLGADAKTGLAFYEEDDIEVPFDIPLTNDILETINSIRYSISDAIEEGEDLTDATLYKIQRNLRQSILLVMEEKKEYKEPEYFDKVHRWGCLNSKDILRPDDEGDQHILPMIPIVKLRRIDVQRRKACQARNLQLKARKLYEEKCPSTATLDERCELCMVSLETFLDLQLHIESTDHVIKATEAFRTIEL